MADKKISELTLATTSTGGEMLETLQGGVNKQIAFSTFILDEDNMDTDSEGKPPSQQSSKRYTDSFIGIGTTSGTNDYTVNMGSPRVILTSGRLYTVLFSATSTGPATLDIQSSGAKKIFLDTTTQADADDLQAGMPYSLMYRATLDGGNGGYLMVKGAPGGGGGGAVDSVNGQTGVVVLNASDVGAASLTGAETLTNKRITARVQSVTSSATVTPSWDNDDAVKITAQATGLTLANPTGIPTAMQPMIIRITDNGTSRSISYGTQYRAVGVLLPASTTILKTIYLGGFWNSEDSKFDVTGVSIEA